MREKQRVDKRAGERTIAATAKTTATAAEISGVATGCVLGTDEEGRPIVSRGERVACPAVAEVVWMARDPDWSSCVGLRVVLGFPDEAGARPLVLGLLDAPPRLKGTASTETGKAVEAVPRRKQVRIESEEELILECGKARISLRADGKIVILGGHGVSRSRGVNKIKGGSVQIN